MICRRPIVIKHEKGLHSRIAAMVVHKASKLQKKHKVKIFIIDKDNYKIPAVSLIMLVSATIKKGDKIIVEVFGDNPEEALEDICSFLQEDIHIKNEKDMNQIDKIIDDSTNTLGHIINSMANGVIAVNEKNIITVFNSAAEKMLGYTTEKVVGKNIIDVLPGSRLNIVSETQKPELASKLHIGQAIVLANRTPILINGEAKGAVAIFEDISRIERVTDELFKVKKLKEQLQLILESVQDGICVVNKEGFISYVNSAYLKILGQAIEDVINKHIDEISPEGARKEALKTGEKIIGAISYKKRDTATIANVNPIIIDGQIHGVVSVVKNISEVQELSEKLNMISNKAEYLETELLRTKKPDPAFKKFKGRSGKVLDVIAMASKAAKCNSTVLIRGESGTGKELIAEGIHYGSEKAQGPFIRVNCAAIPSNLIESELFGHEKGAFTGAVKTKLGKFELAHNGTIFLDEIGELEKNLQAKILRVVQNKEIQRVGGEKIISVNVRIIAATHRDLEQMVEDTEFREDLYYRLNVIPIMLPALRERKEDIPLLIEHFIENLNNNNYIKGVKKEVIDKLMNYDWPGNVRELENTLERMIALTDNRVIDIKDLPIYIRENSGYRKGESKPINIDEHSKDKKSNNEIVRFIEENEEILTMKEYEKIIIEKALKKYGSYNAAGKALGITHKTVSTKARQYGIEKVVMWKK